MWEIEHFAFIVDNGPSEASSGPLVRMWLVRLAGILKLKSVTQKSFAEYHSKRYPVERVHAAQNHALSNEKFSSKGIHPEYGIGDDKHKANMEHMAEEVRKCLVNTQYGGSPCVAMHGIGGQENFVFNDEEHLVSFLGKNETSCSTIPSKSNCGGRLQPYGTWTKITQEATGKTTKFCRARFTKKDRGPAGLINIPL